MHLLESPLRLPHQLVLHLTVSMISPKCKFHCSLTYFWNCFNFLEPVPRYILNTSPWQTRLFPYLARAHPSRLPLWHLPDISLQPPSHQEHRILISAQNIVSLCSGPSFLHHNLLLPGNFFKFHPCHIFIHALTLSRCLLLEDVLFVPFASWNQDFSVILAACHSSYIIEL